ncbi:unnamed protein product (macronuclear) [Paramecium tetraurelia]|uniref:PH domain-containing protein n=1 Tax=Paramecium tetraurelia TaxID=5888 RepID=A0DSZ4_PARTE|nr:uncharacterized protein GSPATT00019854001 [Paramecium tetraurelia]CAK86161.1 unnamed protein product [Paramecium tetraurelia]|eukprot:XP_001453558.1 hypothetical protein (macronuclear) [Paramecium tetraurelia strain d4-2]
MFEKILQRILFTYFGKFITGFDQTNLQLGIWNGNVVIENVALKQEILADLELPLELKFSSIGRLILKIPWNKLSSAPVEVVLENILIVFTPMPKQQWNNDDSIQIKRQFTRLLDKVKSSINIKRKDQRDNTGYFEKLTLRVIDNLQISLQNIHFRFENQRYSWGIKMDSLTALTTNEEFVVAFVDRSNKDTKLVPKNKLIKLQQLQLYWNSKETTFISDDIAFEQLTNFDQVIQISALCKLIINHKERFDKANYLLDVQLEEININIKHTQLIQIIQFLELISNNEKRVWSHKQDIMLSDINKYQQEFCDVFLLFLKNDWKEIEQLGDVDQILQFKQTIRLVPFKQLESWSLIAQKKHLLDLKVQEYQRQKQKKGWFNFFGGQTQEEVSDTELKQLEEFIDNEETSLVSRPSDSLKLKFIAKLNKAQIQLIKDNNPLQDEGIVKQFEYIEIEWAQCENKDFAFSTIIKSISLQLIRNTQFEVICQPTQQTNEFLKLSITQTTTAEICKLDFRFLMQSLTINYNPGIIRIIREITEVKKGDYVEQTLKTATWNQIEKIQDTTESTFKNVLQSNIQLKIDAKILEPILELSINSNEFWLVKMDSFYIRTTPINPEDLYENFEISISNFKFLYYPERFGNQTLQILNDYNLVVQIQRLQSIHNELINNDNTPLVIAQAKLNEINVMINEKVYKHLVYLPETIYPKLSEGQILQQLQLEKQLILKYKVKDGFLKRQGQLIKTWSSQYVVLSNFDLYFYDQEKILMANSQISLFNSTLKQLQVDDQLYSFKIRNKSGEYIFACENQVELRDWIKKIKLQIEQYQSYQEIKQKQNEQIKVKQNDKMQIDILINKLQLKLYKENNYPSVNQEHLLFLFKLNNLKFQTIKLQQIQQIIQIKNLSIQDWIFDYQNTQYQDLIILSNQIESQPALRIDITPKKQKIQVDQLQINWKPDTFLKIKSLLGIISDRKSRKWYFAGLRDFEAEQMNRGNNCDQEQIKKNKLIDGLKREWNKCQRYGQSKLKVKHKFDTLIDHQNFLNDYQWVENEILSSYQMKSSKDTLMELETSINFISVNFFNRTSHCLLFKCEMDQVQFTFKQLQFSQYLDTQLQDFSLYDMTNYPFTINSNREFDQIKPYKLIGKRDIYDDWAIRFRFSGYDEIIIANQERVNTFLLIEINPIFACYQNQPLMRQIDYIVNQIVTLIREPESLTMNTEYSEQRRMNNKNLKVKRVWGDVDLIQSKFICPTFIDIRIVLTKPLIILKGWPEFQEYFQLDCDVLKIYNKQEVDMSRLIKGGGIELIQSNEQWMPDGRIKEAWNEAYCIEGHNMQIQYYENGVNQVSSLFEFNLSFERVLYYFEIKDLYDNVEMDRSIKIRSCMSPMILKLYRKEYLEICKMIFHNFTHDDFKDKLYIHDFDVVNQFEPAPISFWLDFENLSIFALSKKSEQPLVQINMKQMRLEWLKETDVYLNLFSQWISMYNYDKFNNEFGFLGELGQIPDSQKLFQVNQLIQGYKPKEQREPFTKYIFDENFNKQQCQFSMIFHIQKPSADKRCHINLNDVRMIVEPTVFTNVGLWSRLEQQCWPIQTEFGEMPSITVIIKILGSSLCFQGLDSQFILGTKGDISYVWNRCRFMNPEQILINLKRDQLDKNQVEIIGDAFEHQVNLKNLEFFKCKFVDYINFDLKTVRKRQIIMPFSLFLSLKNELQVEFNKQFIYYNNKLSFYIDKTICKFSYQDFLLMTSISDKLKSSTQNIIREPIYQQEEIINQEQPINDSYDVIISGLQVVVINDAGEVYVPVFDVTLSETQLQFQKINQKSIYSTIIKLSSSFYNPKIAVWEPILESCNFSVDVSLNPKGEPQCIIYLEMTQEQEILNINLSAQMISVFHKTFISQKQEMEISNIQQQQIFQDDRIDNVDYVSPYTIRNETGFELEISDTANKNKKYILESSSSINYEIDADFDQIFRREREDLQQQQQRLVTIKVIHDTYEFEPINPLDLDCIKVTRCPIKPSNKYTDMTFMLFMEVVPKDTRKLLLISSEIIIFNQTDRLIDIKLFDMPGQIEQNIFETQIAPYRAFSVPIDRTRQYFNFKFNGHQKYCNYIYLRYLQDNFDQKYEQQHNGCYTIIRCSKRNVNQTLIYLESPFQIKNCLPVPISVELYGDSEQDLSNDAVIIYQQQMEEEQSNLTNITLKHLDKYQYDNLQKKEKGQILKQQQKLIDTISTKGRLAITVKLPYFQISGIHMLYHAKFGPFQVDNIQLCDNFGNTNGYLLIDQIKNVFYIYCQQMIVNELPFKVYSYGMTDIKKGSPTLIAGQHTKEFEQNELQDTHNITLFNDQQYLSFSISERSVQLSETLNLNYTGNQTVRIQNSQNQIMEVGYNISLMCVDKQKPLVTKVLTISPRFIIVNQTQKTIHVLQESIHQYLEINSMDRKPLVWYSLRYQYISIHYLDDNIEWKPTNPIDPNGNGFQCFTMRAVNNQQITKHFNCITKIDNQIVYLIILECKSIDPLSSMIGQTQINSIHQQQQSQINNINQVDPPYVIVNNLELVTLICYQYCCSDEKYSHRYQFNEYKLYINNNQQCAFSWEYPCERRELAIHLQFEGDLSTHYRLNPIYINLEEAEAVQEYIISSLISEQQQYKFYIISLWEGASRKLKFQQKVQDQQNQHDTNILKFDVNLNQVGISLIDQCYTKRVELIFIYFEGLEFNLLQTTQSKRSEFRVKYINIDNNTSSKTMFPVIFTPTAQKEIFEFNKPHLSLVLEQSTQVKSISLIKNFTACLQPTTIRLTSEMLEILYSVYKQITLSFISNRQSEEQLKQFDFEFAISQDEQQIFQQANSLTLSNKVQSKYGVGSFGQQNLIEWQELEIQLNDQQATYINKIEISPLNFNLTFYSSAKTNLHYNMLMQIFKTIGIVIGNIDDAPLILGGIFLENSFDTSNAILNKLTTHYKDMLFNLILKLIGSIEFFGNPVGLVKHLAKGVYDLFDKPLEGFIKGPVEGSIGIVRGAGSLVQNTVSGVSNSTSKIAGSISGSLAYISLDKQYKQQREQIRVVKPNQIISGIYLGGRLLYISLNRAFVGVFDIPVTQARRKGIKGLTIGVLEGTAGFFIKPFAGVFDFVSKTTDGLKATAQYWNDKANDKRTRDIRVIYQKEQLYKNYNARDAEIMQFLVNINNKLEDYYYYDSFEYESGGAQLVFVLMYQQFFNCDRKKKRFIWQIDPSSVQDIKKINDGVLFLLKEYNEKYKAKQVQLHMTQQRQMDQVILKSQWLLSNI